MKVMIMALLLALAPPEARMRAGADTLRVLFWNLENFFDWRNDSTSVSEAEFSSKGERHWSWKRFQEKADAIAKSILWTAGHEGGLPDVIGFAEVENALVLKRLLQGTALRKLDYKMVHYDSPDPRGIDVALLYRSSRLQLIKAYPIHLFQADTLLRTRDILLVQLKPPNADTVSFLVNHHPSKYGGKAVSEPRRQIAVERLKFLADSLAPCHIVAMGDFNDTPANPVFKLLEPSLVNLAEPLHRKGEGTIKYQGKWELIDMFFVSPELAASAMKILRIPFLMVEDKAYSGEKPLRTYSGPRYQGGVSDHCPIWLTVVSSLRSE